MSYFEPQNRLSWEWVLRVGNETERTLQRSAVSREPQQDLGNGPAVLLHARSNLLHPRARHVEFGCEQLVRFTHFY